MNVIYSPQRNDDLNVKHDDDIIFIKSSGEVNKIDFSSVDNGRLNSEIAFIANAEKVDGKLSVEVIKPVDKDGTYLDLDDFNTSNAVNVDFEWETWEEIEAEKNQPKPPNDKDRIDSLEAALTILMMEGS